MYSKGTIPATSVTDYTPYVQAVMTSDGGKPPDTLVCLLATQCINMYSLISAGGYTGTYYSALYDPRLVGLFKGATSLGELPAARKTPRRRSSRWKTDINAIKSGHGAHVRSGRRLPVGRLLHPGAEEGRLEPDARDRSRRRRPR